jgi:hypothetical protein
MLSVLKTKNPRLTGNRGFLEILVVYRLESPSHVARARRHGAPNGHLALAADGTQTVMDCFIHVQTGTNIKTHAVAGVKRY